MAHPSTLLPHVVCRVLCVEDDPAMQRTLVRALVQPGFAVECVRDGQEALARFADDRRDLDVLVVDSDSPRLNARALVAEFRARGFAGLVLGTEWCHLKPDAIEALRAALIVRPSSAR